MSISRHPSFERNMNKRTRNPSSIPLILTHAFANTLLGLSFLLWSNPSAENVLNRIFPAWFWPAMFLVAGIMAFCGIASILLARFAFAFAAIVMGVFALASAYAVFQGNISAIPTTVFLAYLCILKLYVAGMLDERAEIVQQIVDATAVAQTTLDKAKDGNTATR
jgi:hypothetical protein